MLLHHRIPLLPVTPALSLRDFDPHATLDAAPHASPLTGSDAEPRRFNDVSRFASDLDMIGVAPLNRHVPDDLAWRAMSAAARHAALRVMGRGVVE